MADLKVRLGRGHEWDAAANDALERLWTSGLRLSAIAKQLNRTMSACYRHAQALDLAVGCPEGFEYIEAAARRTGYCPVTLRRILAFGGVRVHLSLSDPSIKRTNRYRRHYVDEMDVDDAVEKWMAAESVGAAARARNVSDDALRRWLRAAGVIDDNPTRSRVPQRVASTVIDRVVAEHRAELARTQPEKNRQAASIRWQRHREQRSAA